MNNYSRLNRTAIIVLLGLLGSLAAGCGSPPPTPTDVPQPTPTLDLPMADGTAHAFLQAWERSDYLSMYELLSPSSRERYSEERFAQTYRLISTAAEIESVTPRIQAVFQPDAQAQVSFSATFQTTLLGSFEVQNQMPLTYDGGRWSVDWSPSLIFPQLSDGASVHLERLVPSRGLIYDRNGKALAVQGEMVLVDVGVVPGEIEDEPTLLAQLSAVLGDSPNDIKSIYADQPPDWYVYLGRISADAAQSHYEALSTLPGIRLEKTWGRSYIDELVAPHVVGVVGPIPQDDVADWKAKGYTGDEQVGLIGLERWGEDELAGQRGGRLEILSSDGQQVAILAEKPVRVNNNLYTTFEYEFQKRVQDILGERLAAIAVLEAKTGRVLALATYPLFDPNLFPVGISTHDWQALQSDPRRPLVNRATQGTYPPGSTFKTVTMMAAMEEAGLTAESEFICRGIWKGLGPQWPKTCWARSGHGRIPLNRALTVSCDITFYQVALALNGQSQELLPEYARLSGFGAPTGIEVEESAGLLPDPTWKISTKGEGWAPGDTVNLSIGQGELLVSPLQLAVLFAALGNGGTLYQPQVVEMAGLDLGNPEKSFEPIVAGHLPISSENLAVIQRALRKVTTEPYGTAHTPFKGLDIVVAGKTGTSESGQEEPHSWFAGYVPAADPEIAIAAIVEHSGEGAKFAAPMFRKVVEAYFGIESSPEATTTPDPASGATPVPATPTP